MMENIRILLAEDDEDDRSFFRQALLDSSIESELTAVTDGRQLIDFLVDAQDLLAPDVIFLDINMPGMDGKACLREIRRQEKYTTIPVIILSTSTRLKDIEDTYRDGANRYISKMLFYSDSGKWMMKLFAPDWRQGLAGPSRELFAFIDQTGDDKGTV
jgi:CheY-like chemotaxis protein